MLVSPLRKFRVSLAVTSWVTFAVSLTLYWITADPDVSYWDCPEYVTLASRMEVGHPPGNPIWMLAMRVATIPFPATYHAYVVNLCSGLLMAFAAFFLCRVIFIPVITFVEKSLSGKGNSPFSSAIPASLISIGASLCFSFCDAAWYSAVEAEVYAMSTFLGALSLWLLSIWWWAKSTSGATRLLILVAYITGLAIGVHQLNLLLIPVFFLTVFFRLNPRGVNPLKTWGVVILSFVVVGIVLTGFMSGTLTGAKAFELMAVNRLGLPYGSGVVLFMVAVFCAIAVALWLVTSKSADSLKLQRVFHNSSIVLWMGAFLLLGFSSFGVILIRAQAYPPLNEGSPDNIFSLSSYIARDQYPSTPLLYGPTPYSRPIFEESFNNGKPYYSRYVLEKGIPVFIPVTEGASLYHRSGMLSHQDSLENEKIRQKGHGYILSDFTFRQMLTPELNLWFPRITSRKPGDLQAYEDWAGMTEDEMDRVTVSEVRDYAGEFHTKMHDNGMRTPVYSYRPTYIQNLRFFVAYQSYYMYFRYLFWNFIGRQNDFHSTGEIDHGNFITGFDFIDEPLAVITPEFPDEIGKNNKGYNRYFAIPFLLGLIGFLTLLYDRKRRRIDFLISLLFLMTGMAIVVFLNQTPGEPRERDYTFLLSYLAFTMWIGAGMTAFLTFFHKILPDKVSLVLIVIIALGTPALMAVENFDDHDRRGRFETAYYAKSILDFEYPSVIFSHGDNSSFPLWYASEVLDEGPDHTPVDVTYLALPSYVANLKMQGRKGITTPVSTPQMIYGKYLLTKLPEEDLYPELSLDCALSKFYADPSINLEFPTAKIRIPVSSEDSVSINLRAFTGGSSYLPFKTLMLMDLIASNSSGSNAKALFFPYLIDRSFHRPLSPALRPVLFGEIYAPQLSDEEVADILKVAVDRELLKINNHDFIGHYTDPVISDRTVRYRGELIIAANNLIESGDAERAARIADTILKKLPYDKILPGSFTVADTTFYEGKEFVKTLTRLYDLIGEKSYKDEAGQLMELMDARNKKWLRYYRSLTPEQRKTLSNRSRRLLLSNS